MFWQVERNREESYFIIESVLTKPQFALPAEPGDNSERGGEGGKETKREEDMKSKKEKKSITYKIEKPKDST